jgi:predicted secreted hydrolase
MRSGLSIVTLVITIIGGLLWYRASTALPPITGQLSAVAAASGGDDPRWQRVTAPRPFTFPADHGPHPEYQTEWWYYTGNLRAEDGHEFGFQLTFFRRGLDPQPTPRASRWATDAIYLAHFTVTDITAKRFYAAERFSRDGANLAGASGDPYRVFIDRWQATGEGAEGMTMRLQAQTEEMAIDLRLQNTKPPTLQGDRGYSAKGSGEGNASYYYSLTRMATTGQITVGGTAYAIVDGTSWMDHEWGTSRLESGGVGWDWFALQLDDGREITWAQLRRADGTTTPASFGSLTGVDGTTTPLRPGDVELRVTDYWTSPRSGARYPAGWHLLVPQAGLDLMVSPRVADQELPVSIVYWEGAVGVEGTTNGTPVVGRGYVELTGYVPNGARVPGR